MPSYPGLLLGVLLLLLISSSSQAFLIHSSSPSSSTTTSTTTTTTTLSRRQSTFANIMTKKSISPSTTTTTVIVASSSPSPSSSDSDERRRRLPHGSAAVVAATPPDGRSGIKKRKVGVSLRMSSSSYTGEGDGTNVFSSSASSEGNDDDDDGDDDETNEVRVQPDTHDELMYALGVNLARQLGDVRPLVESGEELAQVAKGLLDTVVGRLNDDGQRILLSRRGKELDGLIQDRANALRDKLEQRGREMLKNMQETEGVINLDTGVVVHVLEQGDPNAAGAGTRPTHGSVVLIHYHGTLSDGTVFDSTLGGDPVKFPLAQVIPGWRDGVLQMQQGDTAMLGIPPEQAYGSEGTPDGRIPGGSTLFFKIQLVEVLSSGVGGDPTLLGADGSRLGGGNSSSDGPGLVGADGRPL